MNHQHGNYKHGLAAGTTRKEDPIYRVHGNILLRCFDVRNRDYRYYGGCSIGMWPEWVKNVAVFREYVLALPSYKPGLTLDRIDANRNYEPDNVRWVTKIQQQRNQRSGYQIHQSWLKNITGAMSLPHMGMSEYLQRRSRYQMKRSKA